MEVLEVKGALIFPKPPNRGWFSEALSVLKASYLSILKEMRPFLLS